MLRVTSWALSAALHAAVLLSLTTFVVGGAALEGGTGDDLMMIEQGIAVEGTASAGVAAETVDAVEIEPQEASVARPQIEEVKPEEPEEQKVVTSETGPDNELKEIKETEVVEEQRQEQVATLEQAQQTAVEEQKAAGAAQKGGDTTQHSLYLGKLRKHLERNKINPGSRISGTVVVRFTVDPSGNVQSREVAESSGSKTLDEAAVRSIDKASPFPPFPVQSSSEPLVVSVPFKFVTR